MRLLPLLAASLLLTLACGGGAKEDDTGGGGTDGDTDTDSDTDSDTDTDTDTDTDVTPPGEGVLLYVGNGGGAYDIDEDALAALYDAADVTADISDEVPSDLADRYGTILLLSPTSGFPAPGPARDLLARGGTVVVSVEHGSFGDWEGATDWLGAVGSTMSALGGSDGRTVELTVTDVGPATAGVSALVLFYFGDIDVGDGVALGVRDGDEPGIGWEAVGPGQVILVPDGSMFGYSLNQADNRRFFQNLAP